MELLLEIKDKAMPEESTVETREACRAVAFDDHNLIPLLFVAKYNYHKLPGGGIENQEDKITALHREILEETGSTIEVTGEVGKIIQYLSKFNLKQTSYCYLGKIVNKGKPNFTDEELNNGFKIVWLSLDDAINKVVSDKPKSYDGPFIQKRDLKFLQKAKEIKLA